VTGKVTMPCVIEPAVGLDRILLAFLTDAYDEETNVPTAKDKAKPGEAEGDTRVVLRLHEDLAPYKFAVLPLMKKVRQRFRYSLRRDHKSNRTHARTCTPGAIGLGGERCVRCTCDQGGN
jgi:glycyl-tRNA synthetase